MGHALEKIYARIYALETRVHANSTWLLSNIPMEVEEMGENENRSFQQFERLSDDELQILFMEELKRNLGQKNQERWKYAVSVCENCAIFFSVSILFPFAKLNHSHSFREFSLASN